MGLGITKFHAFIKGPFRRRLLRRYKAFDILSEADLQTHAYRLLRRFLRKYPNVNAPFKVLNSPYFKDLGIHPDIGIFKGRKPWVLMELKESRKLTRASALCERRRLIKARKSLKQRPKRAYLVCVARFGDRKALKGPKGEGAWYFFEIPIVLERYWTERRILEWERRRKKWSKYTDRQ